ncbi:hypothetical protein LOTGIDRAFT_156342 [Lottia gigantea]|uniref:Spermatogenesis-associated protein 20-like TRX domain-containing protein n=1 Tax=Lottia gigantea TaxID=225164 RepID=V4B812_LOTGI|nr:hypothetical protein LOTGIDRAFT_156342 [Lottia gigantea]ESP03781.1 hypothetical protein LOTGIDRAFT_156342 [Lottia gigantea]
MLLTLCKAPSGGGGARNHRPVLELVRKLSSKEINPGQNQNKLKDEKSPYLLQHANNPVHWYPWGEEAFKKAREENKMIFLSIGFSTCHWCHVMERESFQDEEIGRILNEDYISIKVDKEERPDIDRIYMLFVEATSEDGGGWPLNVWLTPELKPVFGGTYFPPDGNVYNRPGFKSVLLNIANKWKEDSKSISADGARIIELIDKATKNIRVINRQRVDERHLSGCYDVLTRSFDSVNGGFDSAPKFPRPCYLEFFLRYYSYNRMEKEALEMAVFTLEKMARGGIYDHIGNGFHRYSTDNKWHVPHFEKMLYDQAQLVVTYLHAYQITKNQELARIGRNILEYILRDLSHPSGGFYTAEDADSFPTHDATEKTEGAYYTWTKEEIDHLLSGTVEGHDNLNLSEIFCWYFNVKDDGNVDPYQDPHGEFKGKNILFINKTVLESAEHFSMTTEQFLEVIEQCREILYTERLKRPCPHLDTKIVSSLNGLMLTTLSKAGQILGDQKYVDLAKKTGKFILTNLYSGEVRELIRSVYVDKDGSVTRRSPPIAGFSEDYAFVIQGLLDLYETTFNGEWLRIAKTLSDKQSKVFMDPCGGFFDGPEASSLILSLKEDSDGALPSHNSVSALNLQRLSAMLNNEELYHDTVRLLYTFHTRLVEFPRSLPALYSACLFFFKKPVQIIITGRLDSESTQAMIKVINSFFIFNKVVLVVGDPKYSRYLEREVPVLKNYKLDGEETIVSICDDFKCLQPLTSAEHLHRLIETSMVATL